MSMLHEEKILLRRCSKGDREAFAVLYTVYVPELLKYIFLFTRSKESSEEIVQDVFVKIWEKKELLVGVQSFRPYLFKVAKNHLLDEFRKQKAESHLLTLLDPSGEEEEAIVSNLIYGQYYQIAQDAIDRLPQKRQEIFRLRTQHELSLDEIAQKLAISKSVVKKQLYAATDFVREYLRKYGEMTIEVLLFTSLMMPV